MILMAENAINSYGISEYLDAAAVIEKCNALANGPLVPLKSRSVKRPINNILKRNVKLQNN